MSKEEIFREAKNLSELERLYDLERFGCNSMEELSFIEKAYYARRAELEH